PPGRLPARRAPRTPAPEPGPRRARSPRRCRGSVGPLDPGDLLAHVLGDRAVLLLQLVQQTLEANGLQALPDRLVDEGREATPPGRAAQFGEHLLFERDRYLRVLHGQSLAPIRDHADAATHPILLEVGF